MSIRSRLRIRTRLRSILHRIWPSEPKPVILMYHRIADELFDPWGLAVSPAHLEEHLRVLRRTRHPLPLSEFVDKLMASTLPPDAVALTFDDGYVDNLVAAKPRLAAADIPATIFLPTGYLDRTEPFWWDDLARLILLEDGPQSFELVVRGRSLQIDFGNESPARVEESTPADSLQKRHTALRTLRQTLRLLDEEERQLIMLHLGSIIKGRKHNARLGRAMTRDEVRAIASDGLVTLGAHTVTHPVLAGLGAAACKNEIGASKHACEVLAGKVVTSFAYPYGDFDANAREAVRSAGFALACSDQRGPALATSDIFALPRIYIPDMDGDAFEQALRSV